MPNVLFGRLWRALGAVALIFVLLVTRGVPAPVRAAEPPPRDLAELQGRIAAVLRERHVPGAGVTLVSRDQILWVAGLGAADAASGKPVTPDTRFRIGSISKTFIALSALQQQEAGRLSLEDTLRERAPEIQVDNPWEASDPVRIADLLEHTAGFADLSLHDYGLERPQISLRDSLAETAESRVVGWRPGTYHYYSNVGPVAAAYVVEKTSGQRYDDYVREHFFRPLGMATADFFLPADAVAAIATSYEEDGRALPLTNPIDWPSGSISLAPKDMAP